MLNAPDHLQRMSAILRHRVGPAVTSDDFARTQAFMASVVLDKLSRQLAAEPGNAQADASAVAALALALAGAATPQDPPALAAAVAELEDGLAVTALSRLVAQLYADRRQLGPERFERLLGLVRPVLRARLDRQLEYSA